MKVLLLVLMVSGVALAGRGGGGRKKTWYGPVASEAECEAAGRSSSVTFKTEDIASTLCRDVNINFKLKNSPQNVTMTKEAFSMINFFQIVTINRIVFHFQNDVKLV